jgi:hypothetical protein
MQTTTDSFHTMRGHVTDGCIIVSPSGKRFTLKNTMQGWTIFGPDGHAVSGNLPTARDVEFFVVNGLSSN